MVKRFLLLTAPVLVLGACGGSFEFQIGGQSAEEAAIELIDSDLAKAVGLGPLTTTCDEVVEPEVGSEFTCRSITGEGDTIEWAVLIDREDHIDVQSQNVVLLPTLEDIENNAVEALYGDNPLEVSIDCGDRSRVLDQDNTMICDAATAAEPTVIHDATVTITDTETGAFDVLVSDEPRP